MSSETEQQHLGYETMVRTTFTKKLKALKALGEIPTPEGHSGRNKGISSYFFDGRI